MSKFFVRIWHVGVIMVVCIIFSLLGYYSGVNFSSEALISAGVPSVEEIESQVSTLPDEEIRRLQEWLNELYHFDTTVDQDHSYPKVPPQMYEKNTAESVENSLQKPAAAPESPRKPAAPTLKLITVTSPRPSHPSISIINQTLTVMYWLYPELSQYRHVVSFDGCPDKEVDKDAEKYWESKWCARYRKYFDALKLHLSKHEQFSNVELLPPKVWGHRSGLGGTIKHAFDHFVKSEDIVYIQQEDMMFLDDRLDWGKVVEQMQKHEDLNYIRLRLDFLKEGESMWEYRWTENTMLPQVELDLFQSCSWSDHNHFVKPSLYYWIFDELEKQGILDCCFNAPETRFDHEIETCDKKMWFFYGKKSDTGLITHLDGMNFKNPGHKTRALAVTPRKLRKGS